MKRLLVRAALAAALVGLLVACEGYSDPTDLSFTMQPSGTLGYEVSPAGAITITSRNLVFRNPAGAQGLLLQSYRIEFYDHNDAPVSVDDNVQEGSLSMFVPPGIQCEEPDPQLGCTMASAGWRFAPGPQAVSETGYQLLPIGIAQEHLLFIFPDPQPIGWHADITFTGRTTTGASYTSPTYRVGIAPPN